MDHLPASYRFENNGRDDTTYHTAQLTKSYRDKDGELKEDRQEVLEPEVLAGMKKELLGLRAVLDRPGRDDDA